MLLNRKLKIISRNEEPFIDRVEAGALLAKALEAFKGPQTVVLGIPRGGLVVAREVARGLQAPLDIVLSRKLGAPYNPELAIGAMTEEGEVFWDQALVRRIPEEYLNAERSRQFAEIQQQRSMYRDICLKTDLHHKDVIVVDDGIATGSTVQAAFLSIRREGPRKLIGAFPVGPEGTLLSLCESADEIVCLKVPAVLQGVGRFYFHFEQVPEEEVLNALKECGANL